MTTPNLGLGNEDLKTLTTPTAPVLTTGTIITQFEALTSTIKATGAVGFGLAVGSDGKVLTGTADFLGISVKDKREDNYATGTLVNVLKRGLIVVSTKDATETIVEGDVASVARTTGLATTGTGVKIGKFVKRIGSTATAIVDVNYLLS